MYKLYSTVLANSPPPPPKPSLKSTEYNVATTWKLQRHVKHHPSSPIAELYVLFDVKVWLYGAVAASVGASRALPSRGDTELRIRLDGKTRRTNIPSSYSLRDKPPDLFYNKIHVLFSEKQTKKKKKCHISKS